MPAMNYEAIKKRIAYAKKKGEEPREEDLQWWENNRKAKGRKKSQPSPAPRSQEPAQPSPQRSTPQPQNTTPQEPHQIAAPAQPKNETGRPSYVGGKRGKDWQEFTAKRLGPLVILLIWIFTRDIEKAEFYAPTPDECKELAPHVARLAPRIEGWLNVPTWGHDLLVTSDDTISLITLVAAYLDRTGLIDKAIPGVTKLIKKENPINGTRQTIQPIPPGAPGGAPAPGGANTGELDLANVRGIGGQYE